MIEPEPLQQVDRTWVSYRRRKLSYFSGCDYFRLASHPSVLEATPASLKKFGLNVSASRATTGNHEIYRRLEAQLAEFFDAEDALVVPTGYLAGLIVAQALAGDYSHAFIDDRAHSALFDAAALLNCSVSRFRHRDPDSLHTALNRCGSDARPIVLTDGMFAYDGTIAPLKRYLEVLPRNGCIIVDDAHAAGVLGRTGKGSVEAENVSRDRIIQCITLSKAFGTYGGAVLGSQRLRKVILERSRMFTGSTPFPLPLGGAALTAVKLLQQKPNFRRRLNDNADRVKSKLLSAGFNIPRTRCPIIPIVLETRTSVARLRRELLAADIYPPLLRYPGSPEQGYFRFVISSEHTLKQLDNLIATLIPHSPCA